MILPIILNAVSGKRSLRQKIDEVQQACKKHGIEPEITLARTGTDVQAAAKKLGEEGRPMVAVCGGDGSISAATAELIRCSSTLVVLPGGTLNHFAQDLGIPLELEGALELVTAGEEAVIDVGEVNEDIFLNNSSIGWYPKFVMQREQKLKQGIGKRIASLGAAVEMASRRSLLTLSLHIDGKEIIRETSLLLVANNEYSSAAGSFGARSALTEGSLHVYLVKGEQKIPLLSLIGEGLRGGERLPDDIEHYACSNLVVKSSKPFLHVARDGEVAPVKPPLRYRILPRALKTMVPITSIPLNANYSPSV